MKVVARPKSELCDVLEWDVLRGEQMIVDAVRASGGNVAKAARMLDLSRTHVQRLIRQHGIRDRVNEARREAKEARDPFRGIS